MASVNWLKMTLQKAGAMIKHNGQQEREQGNHSNPHIDKSLTPHNYCIGCDDYKDAYQALKERIAEVDKESPPLRIKKDRVVSFSLETPCPAQIDEQGRSQEFFEKVHELFEDYFGKENVHGTMVHVDEQHEYIDAQTGESCKSLKHAHSLVSAYAEWKDKNGNPRKGINGKNFSTRKRMSELNTKICDMVRQEFGIEYNTGKIIGKSTKKTVEQLKLESDIKRLRIEKSEESEKLKTTKSKKNKAYDELWELISDKSETMLEIDEINQTLEKAKKQLKEQEEEKNQKALEIKKLEKQKNVLLSENQILSENIKNAENEIRIKNAELEKIQSAINFDIDTVNKYERVMSVKKYTDRFKEIGVFENDDNVTHQHDR